MLAKLLPLLNNTPQTPTGVGDKVQTVVNWVTWVGMMVCVLGIIIAGTMMALGQRRGEGGEHAARLGWVIAGCIVIGAASGLVNTLIS